MEQSDVHTGTRIRKRRLDLGVRQADLAKALGISPSYLNLIEHNRRRIAGSLLQAVGQALEVDPNLLTQGAGRAVLDQLQAAAAQAREAPEIERAEEFAARYPGWADVIATQHARIATLETRLEEMSDRITHDPELATSLHAVISAVTSIRSTASILTSDEKLDADWLQRFHSNIHDEAVRLAQSSDALVRYLDAPADQEVPLSPLDEVSLYLSSLGYHIPDLERARAAPDVIAKRAALSEPGTHLLQAELRAYHKRALQMPLPTVLQYLDANGCDPFGLAEAFDVSLTDAFYRLASVPERAGQPTIGLATCDASGALVFQKKIAGFSLSHGGLCCPLWPLFTALGQPGRPVRATAALPGQQSDRFLCYAVAVQDTGTLTRPPTVQATMMVISGEGDGTGDTLPVGPACRICPRDNCHARREQSALGGHYIAT